MAGGRKGGRKSAGSKDSNKGGASATSQQPQLPDGVSVVETSLGTIYGFSVGGNQVEISYSTDRGKRDVVFTVNGGLNKDLSNPREAGVIAVKLTRIHRYDVSRQKEGTVYKTSAWGGDGSGGRRAEAYQRMGFSPPAKSSSSPFVLGNQYGVVKSGKLVPSDRNGKAL